MEFDNLCPSMGAPASYKGYYIFYQCVCQSFLRAVGMYRKGKQIFGVIFVFYDRLVAICREKKIPVTNLVRELGLSSGNLSKWKNGGAPRAGTLQKIADYLGVTTDSLLGNDPDLSRMSGIQYALYHETADVSEETLSRILEFARFAKEQEKKRR